MATISRKIIIHITGSFFFLASVFVFSPDFNLSTDIFFNRHIMREFTGYILLLMCFYLNYMVLIPQLYVRRMQYLYTLILIACFAVVATVPHLIFPWNSFRLPGNTNFPHHPHNEMMMHIGHHFFVFLFMVFVSFTIYINDVLKQTQKEKLSAELSYLKAQINPHFLFNTLNSIYSLALEKSDKTADTVIRLSGLMRYVITEANRDFVSLEKEINYIYDYIELQKARLGETIRIKFQVSGNMNDHKIAPLIFIPFVENAFKYGVNPEAESHLEILISIIADNLKLEVTNNKVNTSIDDRNKSGVGIENTRTRLSLLYPGKHELLIDDLEKQYKVTLHLQLS